MLDFQKVNFSLEFIIFKFRFSYVLESGYKLNEKLSRYLIFSFLVNFLFKLLSSYK